MIPDRPYVADWIAAHAAATPERAALGDPRHGWVTWAQLDTELRRWTERWADAGVGLGDQVVQILPPSPRSVAAGLGAQRAGATLVEVSADLGVDGLGEVLAQTAAGHVVITGRDAAVWARLAAGHAALTRLFVVHPTEPRGRLADLLAGLPWTWIPDQPLGPAAPPPATPDATPLDPHAPALLVYTSGSTGRPRAVVQTHANLDANTRAIARYLALTADDRALATLPLFYCYGRSVLQTHLLVGGSVWFDDRFMYPAVVMAELGTQRCTGFAGVPLTFETLRRHVDLAALDLTSLRYVTQAGGAMHPDTVAWARAAFAPADLFVMYGQTEATARLAYLPPERAADKPGSAGRALDNVTLAIVDDTGANVPPGTVGHVVARGPSITPGYFRAPAETAEILRDGWLWTGDLGHLDDEGYLFLTGRSKDVLKLSGHRVSAREIEEVIAVHPAVARVAVVGVTDRDGSEQAVAVVVTAPGAAPDERSIRRHCRDALAAFKVPKWVRFLDELPLTASHKIAKHTLQEQMRHDLQLDVLA